MLLNSCHSIDTLAYLLRHQHQPCTIQRVDGLNRVWECRQTWQDTGEVHSARQRWRWRSRLCPSDRCHPSQVPIRQVPPVRSLVEWCEQVGHTRLTVFSVDTHHCSSLLFVSSSVACTSAHEHSQPSRMTLNLWLAVLIAHSSSYLSISS